MQKKLEKNTTWSIFVALCDSTINQSNKQFRMYVIVLFINRNRVHNVLLI